MLFCAVIWVPIYYGLCTSYPQSKVHAAKSMLQNPCSKDIRTLEIGFRTLDFGLCGLWSTKQLVLLALLYSLSTHLVTIGNVLLISMYSKFHFLSKSWQINLSGVFTDYIWRFFAKWLQYSDFKRFWNLSIFALW